MRRRNFIYNTILGSTGLAITGSTLTSCSQSGRHAAIGIIGCGKRRTELLEHLSGLRKGEKEPFFSRRIVTVLVDDLLTWDWPQQAHSAGLNTIATHYDPDTIVSFLKSEKGHMFMTDCKQLRIGVEHWLHSFTSLLPRYLFEVDPTLFRMNKDGKRTPDANFCVSNKHTLEIVCEHAVEYAQLLPTSTGRYFYASDDAKQMCFCPKCISLSASEQTLIAENNIIAALRKYVNPAAIISHAAYIHTMSAPREIKPEPGVFLEWAPITRTHDRPITDRNAKNGEHGRILDCLYENLEVFGKQDSQVFEYWFDSYRASGWKTKKEKWVKAPWNPGVLHEDLSFYNRIGIKNITSVTCWINKDYVDRFGEPPLREYGKELLSW